MVQKVVYKFEPKYTSKPLSVLRKTSQLGSGRANGLANTRNII